MKTDLSGREIKKILDEDCFKLSIGDFGKKLLVPANQQEREESMAMSLDDVPEPVGRLGEFKLRCKVWELMVNYAIEFFEGMEVPPVINIFLTASGKHHGQHSICLEEGMLYNGKVRPWLLCPGCDRRCNVLYLPRTGTDCFKCNKCWNIEYATHRHDYRSEYTKVILAYGRGEKLDDINRKIRRPVYRNEPTRHYKRYLHLGQKWELFRDVTPADFKCSK